MQFFLPEWDDLVDPEYDFVKDEYSTGHAEDSRKHDSYIWNTFPRNTPIDGALVSRTKLRENAAKMESILSVGISSFLRLPGHLSTMCDCGAWGYINDSKPSFKTNDMLNFYLNGRFSAGVSVDHLIVESIQVEKAKEAETQQVVEGEATEARPLTVAEKKERWEITVDNALDMLEAWKSDEKYFANFRIVGAIQGWDVDSYREAARRLFAAGYDYIGIGGLARSSTGNPGVHSNEKTVYNVARGVCYEIRRWCEETGSRVDAHLFGFGRPRAIPDMAAYGITSFDSATFMRSAWMGKLNYQTARGNYIALRIPDVRRSPKRKKLKENGNSESPPDDWKVLRLLRQYDQGELRAPKVQSAVLELAEAYGDPKETTDKYPKTLTDKPWKDCDCAICKEIGIEVVVFRGNERNRRRGFHNNWVFYHHKFRKALPKVAVVGMCSGKKAADSGLLPAYRRYLPSPLFKVYWNKVHDLPVDIKVLSAKYGLIDWWREIPDYNKKMDDDEVAEFARQMENELRRYHVVVFAGLGSYRKAAELLKESGVNVEIYPKREATSRPLDVLEYTGQMKLVRKRLLELVGGNLRSDQLLPNQATLDPPILASDDRLLSQTR